MKGSGVVAGVLSLLLVFASVYIMEESQVYSVNRTAVDNNTITVIVDPGHGGEDGGTSGADGTLEKDINLSIAKKLKPMLVLMGYNTVMTRQDENMICDPTLPTLRERKRDDIRKRLALTEQYENSILLSVHQNYYHATQYSGTQVFYDVDHPANQQLAMCIQRSVIEQLQPDNTRTVKTCGSEIYLLHHCEIPAVMVECGFMSNLKELSLLKDENYQSEMAFAIACGLYSYE